MLDFHNNYCMLSTCGLDRKSFKKLFAVEVPTNIIVKFKCSNYIGKIEIIDDGSPVGEFQKILYEINKAFAKYIYADSDVSLESVLVEKLINKGEIIAVAESLTAGMICAHLANIAGCSKVLYEGMVTYNSVSKLRRLKVQKQILENNGAVSKEVALAMLDGLFINKDINYAISTTGVAGPGFDEDNNPPGLVYIGYGSRKDKRVEKVVFSGSRNEIRESATNYAMFLLLQMIK